MNEDKNNYTLTRSQYAKSIGKSVGAVKKMMQRGTLKDPFVYRDGQYFFASKECPRANQVMSLGTVSPPAVNRGNHFNGNYSNIKGNNGAKFKEHNDKVKLIALQKKIPLETAQRYINEFDDWNKHKEQQLQRQIKRSTPVVKHYGGPIRNPGFVSWTTDWTPLNKEPKDEYDKYLEDNFADTSPKNKYYY